VVLAYQGPILTSAVTVGRCADPIEAQLCGNELAAHGIDYHILNQNVNSLGWPYAGLSQVEVQVREQDAQLASRLLARFEANPLDVEPDEGGHDGPIPDPAGEGVLVAVATFDHPRELYDAAATLGAARIDSFLPSLIPRGDRPGGEGRRFVARVRESDLARAREVLSQARADQDEEDDEPRCPACGSWRVAPARRPWPGLIRYLFGSCDRETGELECLRCKRRWTPAP
jgi:DNA-directed RNA polymerase subunit RPC12/RpoP